jgi:subtilisin family serine protease
MMKKYFTALGFMIFAYATLWAQIPEDDYYFQIDDLKADETIGGFEESAENSQDYFFLAKKYRYRVTLKDKKNNPYSVKRPEEFLSQKALDRRKRLGIKVDQYDLPITPQYVKEISNTGVKIHNMSKWNNTVVVEVKDTADAEALLALSFVKEVKKVWEEVDSVSMDDDKFIMSAVLQGVIPIDTINVYMDMDRRGLLTTHQLPKTNDYYGNGLTAVEMLNLQTLHDMGFRGQGMTVAVIDGGFRNVDLIEAFKGCKIIGTKNFAHPGFSIYRELESHGTMVFSTMATNREYQMVGTAPEASYLLLQSEDGLTEQMVEEDNWCAAVEYADSIGVDLITTSLGYYAFDDKTTSHKYEDLDGMTAINSRSASLAASRGLLVLNSAGNEGDGAWKKIGFPADAKDILSVGAVNEKEVNTFFSSLGNTADGRIKPDVMAYGEYVPMINEAGSLVYASGTSFSCPIMCGAVTCLWQAFPNKKPVEIIRAVQAAGHMAKHPNNVFGYGIPNTNVAYKILDEKK